MYSGQPLHRSHCHNCIVPSLKRSGGLHFHPAIMGSRAITPAALLAQRPKWKSKWIQIVSLYKKMWLQRNKIHCPILLFHNNRMWTVVGPPLKAEFHCQYKEMTDAGITIMEYNSAPFFVPSHHVYLSGFSPWGWFNQSVWTAELWGILPTFGEKMEMDTFASMKL